MSNKNIDISRKKDLKILIEDYLERDVLRLEDLYQRRPDKALVVFSRIFQLLCDPTDDYHDLAPAELKGVILEWHPLLTPVWKKIKSAFINYRENVLPEREKHQKMIAALNDPTSPLAEYNDIISEYTLPSDEKTYAIKLKRSPITIQLSFDSDKFFISMEGVRVIDRLLFQLKDTPLDFFAVCDHCGKIIIITRKGKRYHSGCAAKAKQHELWAKDPEGCRQRERNRYRQRTSG
jgi:hypothetical protein